MAYTHLPLSKRSNKKEKEKEIISTVLCVFDHQEVVHKECVHQRQIFNQAYYLEAVKWPRRKGPSCPHRHRWHLAIDCITVNHAATTLSV